MGQAKQRGTFEQRKANPLGKKPAAPIPAPRYFHVSAPIVQRLVDPASGMTMPVAKKPGDTYRRPRKEPQA